MEIIDAYLHCGRSKYEPIEKVRGVLEAAGVSRAVLVQHMGEYDNGYIGSIVESDPQRFAGVLLIDHRQKNAIETLERWHSTGHFRGLRLSMEALAEAPTLFAAAGDLGLAIVLYTPDGIRAELPRLLKELESAPFTRVVVPHLGNPRLNGQTLDDSARDVLELTRFANVYFQISGMKMFCPHPHEALYPLISDAAKKFGEKRLLWGSNYPVGGPQDEYVADLKLLTDGRLPIPRAAIPLVAGENAQRLWFGHVEG